MASGGGNNNNNNNKLVTVDSEELRFQVELEKPSHYDLKVSNATDKNIAFKVKTTSPKKYFVRPNTGIIPPWDTCIIRVTLQAQLQYPPDMQSRDKFLLQCTPVPPDSDSEELPANTFNKEVGKQLEEYKLKVVYVAHTNQANSNDTIEQNSDLTSNQEVQTARAARDTAVKVVTQLQLELDMLKKKNLKKSPGFSIRLVLTAGLIGIMAGLVLKLVLSSPTPPPTAGITE